MINELHPGLQFHQYQLLEQIGVGGQGVVWSAEDIQRNDIVAIKFNEVSGSEENQADDEMFARQLGKLLDVQHSNILPIYDSGLENQVRYLVSPYIAGGSVFETLKRGPLPLKEALRLSSEIASALDYLHGRGIIHRDVTSSNVLLDLRNHAYLADFGLARAVSNTTQAMHTGRGTPLYAPPEQHKRLEITSQSDIYSFGILLFEIFTGKLPWEGETVLGIRQLYSDTELPDPGILNSALPPIMKDVLRHVTSVEPMKRPTSGREVMELIYRAFNIESVSASVERKTERGAFRAHDADDLFDQYIDRWTLLGGRNEPGLTKFALINLDYKTRAENKIQGRVGQFMLFHALMYGYNAEYWWWKVSDPGERLSISSALLSRQNEAVAARILDILVGDHDLRLMLDNQSDNVTGPILETALRSTDSAISYQLLSGLQDIIPLTPAWVDSLMRPELNVMLGKLALEDSDVGDQAARLIGRMHSKTAVNFILKKADKNRLVSALLEIQRSAGHLPSLVPGNIRLKVTMEWIVQRLTAQPAQLFGAYMLALLGTTFGVGAQVYFTYRLPQFMDIARISSSLEQGLITGAILSLSIITTRVIVERFFVARVLPRIVLGTAAGAVGINIAMFIFHVLFLNTPPSGFLLSLGCVLIALAYAVGALIRRRLLRMGLTVSVITLAISGTWWAHAALAASITDLTPLFRYDYNWPIWQVLLTAFVVAVWMGTFGNMVNLAAEEA